MSTQQYYNTTVTIDGESLGIWDTLTTADVTAAPTKHRPGGLGTEKIYPSLPTYGDVTVGRVLELQRDWAKVKQLKARVGKARMSVSDQPLDVDGIPFGTPEVTTGVLTGVGTGGSDSTSADVRMATLTMMSEAVA